MVRQKRYSELSPQYRDEGRPTAIEVRIRADLKTRLIGIAERERRTFDSVIDLLLRDGAQRYELAGSMRSLLGGKSEANGLEMKPE